MPRPANEAPMPPWWVVEEIIDGRPFAYAICGGRKHHSWAIFTIYVSDWSNAKELAELIVQRCKG